MNGVNALCFDVILRFAAHLLLVSNHSGLLDEKLNLCNEALRLSQKTLLFLCTRPENFYMFWDMYHNKATKQRWKVKDYSVFYPL